MNGVIVLFLRPYRVRHTCPTGPLNCIDRDPVLTRVIESHGGGTQGAACKGRLSAFLPRRPNASIKQLVNASGKKLFGSAAITVPKPYSLRAGPCPFQRIGSCAFLSRTDGAPSLFAAFLPQEGIPVFGSRWTQHRRVHVDCTILPYCLPSFRPRPGLLFPRFPRIFTPRGPKFNFAAQ